MSARPTASACGAQVRRGSQVQRGAQPRCRCLPTCCCRLPTACLPVSPPTWLHRACATTHVLPPAPVPPAAGASPISEVRLVGGLTLQDGRVEVRVGGGPWGSVCANIPYDATKHQDVWTLVRATRVARAVCRSLGLRGGTPQGPVYGAAPPAVLTNLACSGEEGSLSQCSFTRPGVGCQYKPTWLRSDGDAPSYFSVACAGERVGVQVPSGFEGPRGTDWQPAGAPCSPAQLLHSPAPPARAHDTWQPVLPISADSPEPCPRRHTQAPSPASAWPAARPPGRGAWSCGTPGAGGRCATQRLDTSLSGRLGMQGMTIGNS